MKQIKLTILAAVLALTAALGFGGMELASSGNDDSTSQPDVTEGDISGPCDEPEHAGDPRCTGAQVTPVATPSPESSSLPPGTITDVSGPCDEAEHANDPRCAGPQRAEDNGRDDDRRNDDDGDISGPCDEVEHANDPRCTGPRGGRVDNSGPGSISSGSLDGDDDGDDGDRSGPGGGGDDDDDRSGSNSGRGGGHRDFEDD